MTLKKLMIWFWSTLAIGGGVSFLFAQVLEWFSEKPLFHSYSQILLSGLTFAAVSLLGFFAYLVFNWLCLGLLRNVKWFTILQLLFLMLVVGAIIYLNFTKYSGSVLWTHLTVPLLILLIGGGIAWLKAKWTQKKSGLPTFFFMVVVTILEAIPSINPRGAELPLAFIFFTVLVLLTCNAWQILTLHVWTKKPKSTKKARS